MTIADRAPGHRHPWLAGLADAPESEAQFWERIAAHGAPLIEPDPASPAHSLVTFVYRDDTARTVVFDDSRFGEAPDFAMERVPGTGTWHITYRYRNDVRAAYTFTADLPLVASSTADESEWTRFWTALGTLSPRPDPHARERFQAPLGAGLPDHVTSVLSLPMAPDQSIIYARAGIARGRLEAHRFTSRILGNERRVWIHTPPGYAPRERDYPFLVAFDGGAAITLMRASQMLDHLLADGRIGPMIGVFVDNGPGEARNIELPCNEAFTRFVETELMAWVRGGYAVSHAASDGFITGSSYGGLAALWLGLQLPHLFGNVISQSASLWWGPGFDLGKPLPLQRYTPEWLTGQFAQSPRSPLRIWMEVGLMELEDRMIGANRRMAAVLRDKGYDLTYSEFAAGHDWSHWRVSLPEALAAMLSPEVSGS